MRHVLFEFDSAPSACRFMCKAWFIFTRGLFGS